MPKNTNKATWRFVKPFADTAYNYGFPSRANDDDARILGQKPIDITTPIINLVIKPNNFLPDEMRKTKTTGSTGSYVDEGKINSAKTLGFRVTKRGYTPRSKKSTALSKYVYVTINSVKYGWRIASGSSNPINLGIIGATEAVGTEEDIVEGASFPCPPRVQKKNANGKTTETYCAPDKLATAEAAGWFKVDDGLYTAAHLSSYINR